MNNPFTAAATGLHIGLLLCCLCGCKEPAPTPADDACVEDATPIAVPEQSVVVPMATKAEVDDIGVSLDEHRKLINTLSQGESDLIAENRKLADRIKTLENKPDCCVMPETKPAELAKAGQSKPKLATGNLIDDAEQRSIDDGQKLIIVLTKDGCSRCSNFKSHVISDSFFRAIDGNCHYQEVNTSSHPDAAGRFDIKPGTLLPIALLWNPATETFHEIPADPFGSQGDFLSELDLPQDEAAPHKRLLNLFRKD